MGGRCAFGAQPREQHAGEVGRGGPWEWAMGQLRGGKGAQGPMYLRGTGEPAGRDRPSPALGAASRHTRADALAAAPGAGLHLQARDQGLESARRAAQTCLAGRRHGALGGS